MKYLTTYNICSNENDESNERNELIGIIAYDIYTLTCKGELWKLSNYIYILDKLWR